MHTDPKAGDSPWHFLPLPRPRGSHKTKGTCPEGLSQPEEKPRGPSLTSPATHLSSRRQPVPSGESLGFPKTRCGPPPILFLPPGFTPLARPAEGSGQDRGALQLCTLGGRRLLIEKRQMLFSSFFPPQLLFLIPRNLPKLFKDRTPGLMRNIEKQTSEAALSLALPTLPASTQEPYLFSSPQSPEPLVLFRPGSSTHCLNFSHLLPSGPPLPAGPDQSSPHQLANPGCHCSVTLSRIPWHNSPATFPRAPNWVLPLAGLPGSESVSWPKQQATEPLFLSNLPSLPSAGLGKQFTSEGL